MSSNSLDNASGPVEPLGGWLLGLGCLALLVRLCGINKGIWTDEGSTLALLRSSDLIAALRHYDHPPLYFLLLKAWARISSTDAFLRLFSVLLSVATVPVVMRWIAFYDRTAALLAGLLTALMPGMLSSGLEIRGYSLLLFATAWAFLEAHRFALGPTWARAGGLACALCVTVSTHLAGAVLLPSVAVYLLACAPALARRREHYFKLVFAFVSPASLFLLSYLVFMKPEVRARTSEAWWMPRPDAHVIGGVLSQLTWLRSWVWLRLALASAHPLAGKLAVAVLAFTALALLVTLLFGNWRASFPLLLSVATHNGLLLVYSLVRLPIFGVRTALPSIICLIGFFAVQAVTVARRTPRRLAIAASVALSLASGLVWVGYQARVPEEPAADAASALRQQRAPHDLVVFYPGFVEGLIRHYDTALSNADIVQAGRMNDALVGEAHDPLSLPELVAQLRSQRPSSVFLVSRADSLALHAQEYETVRAALMAELTPAESQQFGPLWLTRFEQKRQSDSRASGAASVLVAR